MSEGSYAGFRVALAGSCYVPGIRYWIERFLPGCEVMGWHVKSSPETMPEEIAPRLAGADLVITQWNTPDFGPVSYDALKDRHRNLVCLPVVVFTGFHPDIHFTPAAGGGPGFLQGPMDVMHSRIIASAYHLGLPAERVPRLFNALVFSALGYFDEFAGSRDALIKVFARVGYDLSGHIDDWMRGGCFMHTDNHPHIRVIKTMSRLALEKAGFTVAEPSDDPPAPDALANSVVWPVYPELARRLGFEGSTVFLRPQHGRTAEERIMSLEQYVDESYRTMRDAYPSGAPFFPPTLRAAAIIGDVLKTRGLSLA